MEGDVKIIHSRIWRNGRYPGSVIFDVTSIAPTHDKCFELLFKQYPTRRLVSFMREVNRFFCDANFDPVDQTTIACAVQTGLHFPEHNTTIRGALALTADAQIQKLLLSRLPALNEPELITGIRGSLAMYGRILDVGLCREPNTTLPRHRL
ncbi:hypothetical protein CLU79DRAFT_403451, partial [Phycomyces nitens]